MLFDRGRRRFIEAVLVQDRIFATDWFFVRFEAAAETSYLASCSDSDCSGDDARHATQQATQLAVVVAGDGRLAVHGSWRAGNYGATHLRSANSDGFGGMYQVQMR
jgi:hypothetical protein